MERNIDMKEVSDGRFYLANDLVKAEETLLGIIAEMDGPHAAGGWGALSRWTPMIFSACAEVWESALKR